MRYCSIKVHGGVFPKVKKVRFPHKTKIGDVVAAIREKHPMLRSVLSSGVGFRLMYLESEIMMRRT